MMTREEAAAKHASAIVERRRLATKGAANALTPDEARRLAELDAQIEDLTRLLFAPPPKGDT